MIERLQKRIQEEGKRQNEVIERLQKKRASRMIERQDEMIERLEKSIQEHRERIKRLETASATLAED